MTEWYEQWFNLGRLFTHVKTEDDYKQLLRDRFSDELLGRWIWTSTYVELPISWKKATQEEMEARGL